MKLNAFLSIFWLKFLLWTMAEKQCRRIEELGMYLTERDTIQIRSPNTFSDWIRIWIFGK